MGDTKVSRLPAPVRVLAALAAVLLGATLLAVPPVQAAEQVLTASPTKSDNRGVRDGQQISIQGSGPDGTVTGVRLLGLRADGSLVGAQRVGDSALRGDPERDAFVRNDGGTITGRFGLGCMFGPADGPGGTCALPAGQARSVQVEVTLSTGDVLTSSLVPVDFTFPTIRGYRVVAPNTIEVLFSEPVRHEQDDSPLDWQVSDPPAVVQSVENPPGATCRPQAGDDTRLGLDNCVRLLRLSPVPGLPEDAQPQVEHVPAITRLGATYEDYTDNGLDRSDATGSGARGRAIDVVRPAVPSIDRVDGREPAAREADAPPAVIGRNLEPSVRLTNLTPGHKVRVLVTPPAPADPFATGWATAQQDAVQQDGSATVTLFTLVQQGRYELLAETEDLNGNRSTQSTLTAARADGSPNPAGYVLDTLPPALVSARSVGGEAVDVLLSEAVSPEGGDPADWTIRHPDGSSRKPSSVSGSGAQRRLAASDVPGGAVVSYSGNGRYTDEAGNVLPNGEVLVGGISLPRVTVPDSPVFTPQDAFTVRGTAEPGRLVEIFQRDSNGRPAGPALKSQQLAAGESAFALTVPLAVQGPVDLVVVASDGAAAQSPPATVPTITRDSVTPELQITSPRGSEIYAGNSERDITWTYRDANPGAVKVELSLDDGANWIVLSPGERPTSGSNDSGSFRWRTPQQSSEAARIRLTGVDKAGNSVTRVSGAFVIDALLPSFVGETTAPRTVRVQFSEPVSGPVAPGDFRVDGEPAVVRSIDRAGTVPGTASGARTLVLETRSDFGEDANPLVTYVPSPAGQLVDRAGQGLDPRSDVARDGIRPAVPTITAVDGRQPENRRVLGGSVTPQLSVNGVTSGHRVRVERVPAGGPPAAGPEVEASGGTVIVTSPRLPDDGEHVLRVVVLDPTGNASTDNSKNPARADGGPSAVTYVLDSRLPAILFAVVDGDQITVQFTEAVFPVNGDPADWRVTRADGSPVPLGDGSVRVVRVTGEGETRELQATGAEAGDLLVYAPQGQRYADANANPLPDTTTPLLALAPPVVTTPTRALLVTSDSTPVAGTAPAGSTVSLFRRDRTGGPAGSAVASTVVSDDGRWSLTAPLEPDQAHDFLVRARRSDGRDTISVPVPTITQDSTAPVLDVRALPGDQQVIQPGAAYTFQWSVCDANLGAVPMTFEHSLDDGATWTRFGPERQASANDCAGDNRQRVTLPGTTETRDARLRVTATDLAGRSTSVVSPRFVLAGPTAVRDVRAFACPPDRVQPAGFTDTADSTFRFEIDCLAAYGFTKGVSSDRYAPANNVTRAQMAMFVARLGSYGGVALDTSDAGFNDLGDSPKETRDAVNALANLGVVQGVGAGRYDPAGRVSRAQMASFLARLQIAVGERFPASRDAFGDDRGNVHEANIDAIAGAGIVQGTAPGVYDPLAPITRQQMAGFLMRYVDGRVEAAEMRSAY